MSRRLAWLVALAALATGMGLVAGAQLVLLVGRFGGEPPSAAAHLLGLLGFEVGLWGAGLSVWFVGQRLGWLGGPLFAVAVTASPVLGELGISWLAFGSARLSPGIASAPGILLRLLVGGAALTLALWSVRARRRALAARAGPAAGPGGGPAA